MFRETLLNNCRIHKNYNTFKEYFGVRNSYMLCINVLNVGRKYFLFAGKYDLFDFKFFLYCI